MPRIRQRTRSVAGLPDWGEKLAVSGVIRKVVEATLGPSVTDSDSSFVPFVPL